MFFADTQAVNQMFIKNFISAHLPILENPSILMVKTLSKKTVQAA